MAVDCPSPSDLREDSRVSSQNPPFDFLGLTFPLLFLSSFLSWRKREEKIRDPALSVELVTHPHDQPPKIIMLKCFTFNSKSSSNPSQEETPTTSSTPNVSREYNLTINANSYNEIRSNIQAIIPQGQQQLQLLHPNGERVEEALRGIKSTTQTRLVSKYFNHSETASTLCLNLLQRAHLARATYAPLLHLFEPQPNPNRAVPLFLEFDAQHNPLPSSHSFTDIRASLTELKSQLDRRNHRRYRIFCGCACVRVSDLRREQLDAAAKCAYVLNNDLGTIDRLVARVCATVEGDKLLVRLGLERGTERFPIEQVVKQLCKSYGSFIQQLEDLEEHVCLCFYTVNKARALLLQEICSSFP